MTHYIKPLFAFDISEQSLRKCMRENGVLGVLANSLYLPFKKNAFKIVCINGVLHHIVDLERAVRELARVTEETIYISEGIPRGRPSFAKITIYPGLKRKTAYFCYLVLYWFYICVGIGKRLGKKLTTILFCLSQNHTSLHGSKYERPLNVSEVESLMIKNGFKRNRLLYYTNIDIPGDGAFKNLLTKILVNEIVGTHFDLRMDKDFTNCVESTLC